MASQTSELCAPCGPSNLTCTPYEAHEPHLLLEASSACTEAAQVNLSWSEQHLQFSDQWVKPAPWRRLQSCLKWLWWPCLWRLSVQKQSPYQFTHLLSQSSKSLASVNCKKWMQQCHCFQLVVNKNGSPSKTDRKSSSQSQLSVAVRMWCSIVKSDQPDVIVWMQNLLYKFKKDYPCCSAHTLPVVWPVRSVSSSLIEDKNLHCWPVRLKVMF